MISISTLAVFIFCMVGAGYTSYFIGHQAGVEATVRHFIEEGVITLEDEEE